MGTPLQHSNGLVDETYRQLTQQILRALQEIRYGSVEIVIHDSKVVQIERKRDPHRDGLFTDCQMNKVNVATPYRCRNY